MFPLFIIAAAVAESIVETINNDPASTWVAVEYPPEVITLAKMRARLGAYLDRRPVSLYVDSESAPESFDSRINWPGKILGIRNQGSCGSCWAFSVAEAFGDNLEVAGCGHGHLSPQDLVSCDTVNHGCNGGEMSAAQSHIVKNGIATEECIPYTSGGGRVPECPKKCVNGSEIIRYKAASSRAIPAAQMQDTILEFGPISSGFMVYSDFMNYKSGIYQHKTGYLEGGHAILMLGWGVENGVKYWIVQNSWGTTWGEQGTFKILRGTDECSIETYATLAVPQC